MTKQYSLLFSFFSVQKILAKFQLSIWARLSFYKLIKHTVDLFSSEFEIFCFNSDYLD